jgi:hypothetical protein
MDFKDWLAVSQMLALLASVAINVALFVSARRDARWKAMNKRLDGDRLEWKKELTRIDRLVTGDFDRRLTVLAAEVKGMPTHRDLKDMHEQLARIDERSETTAAGVARIEKYLLERK